MHKSLLKKLLFFCVLFFLVPLQIHAEPLDEIQEERIYIETRADGSLDIRYHIRWKVLDSSSEGPLNWVKIGIPNVYVENMEALSDTIQKISYYGSGGDYVRLDLDRDYEAGEVVEMDFSIHQHRMYREEGGRYVYEFTPGWFDEMEIRNLSIFWEQEEGVETDMRLSESEDSYVSFYKHIEEGQRVTVTVSYPMNRYRFQDTYDTRADSRQQRTLKLILAFGGVMGPLFLVPGMVFMRNKRKWKDDYEKNRGFGAAYIGNRGTIHHTGSRGCACACACACAGGGRAGCSRKDFYSAVLRKKEQPPFHS